MIDTTEKSVRYILTPDGMAEIEHYVCNENGDITVVTVWLEKENPKSRRKHKVYRIEDCEEIET